MHKHFLPYAQEEQPAETAAAPASPHRGRLPTLLCACIGFALIILDANVMTVALPALARLPGGGSQTLLWFINIYALIFAALLLTGGILGDRFGAKPVFLGGLLLFALASLAGSLVGRLDVLIFTRALQGVGAALLTPSSLSLITHAYSNPQERARAVGTYSAVSGIGFVGGPLLGGMLIDIFSWRSVFLLDVAIALVAFALTMRYVTPPPRFVERRLDVVGQLLAIGALVSLTYTLIASKQVGWIGLPVLAGAGIFLLTTLLFILVELRSKQPLLPLQLFTSATFSVANFAAFCYNFGLYSLLLMLTLFLQNILRISAFTTGLLFLPLSLTFLLTTSLIAGRIIARSGFRLSLAPGTASCCFGALTIFWVARGGGFVLLVVGLLAFGFGLGLIMPAMTGAVLSSVEVSQAGIGSAVLNMSRQVGGVLGPVLTGTLLTSASFLVGMQSALLLISGCFFLGLVLTLLFVPRTLRESARRA